MGAATAFATIPAFSMPQVQDLLDRRISNDNTTVLASAMVNGVYYAACKIRFGLNTATYGIIMTNPKPFELDGWEIFDEFDNPAQRDCPLEILDLLSGHDELRQAGLSNPVLLAELDKWRAGCRVNAGNSSLSFLAAMKVRDCSELTLEPIS